MISRALARKLRRILSGIPALVVLAAMSVGCSSSSSPVTGGDNGGSDNPGTSENCGDFSEFRNAYFGDVHVHTSNSFDAYLFGNHMNNPQVAYDFAQGQKIQLNDNSSGHRFVQLRRPLDF